MKNKTWLIIAAAFVLLLGGAYLLYSRLSPMLSADQLAAQEGTAGQEAEESARMPMPDFAVYDREGNKVRLSDFRGKPVVLNFWASWCGPCESEMPAFDQAYAELGEDVHFLMVNMTDGARETVEKATRFIDKGGYAFPVFFDKDVDAAAAYGVYALPMTLFIDAEGYGVGRATGAIDHETLRQGIDMILK